MTKFPNSNVDIVRETMELRVLGGTGMHVSPVCLGTMTFGNPVVAEECDRLVAGAIERGVNFFDTANSYEGYDRTFGSGGGRAEELLGKALRGRRDRAIICTKFGNPVGMGPFDAGLSARHLDRELERSLRRLGGDRIDIVLAHRWDPAVGVEEVLRVFERWIQSGKVLAVGVSNWPVWRLVQAGELARRGGVPRLAVSSPKYNLLSRAVELEHIASALHYGVALVPYQPFEGGLLTGKYRSGEPPPEGSRAAENATWLRLPDAAAFERLEALEMLAAEAFMSVAEYALAWVLSRPGVTSVVVGCRSLEQLEPLIAAARKPFPAEHRARIDALFPPPRPAGEQVLRWREGSWCLADLEIDRR